MGELERRNPGVPIDHGERTGEGKEWAGSYYGPHATSEQGTPAGKYPTRKTLDRQVVAAQQLPSGYDMDVREQETTRWGLPALHVRVRHDGKPVAGLSVHQRQDDTTGGALVGHPNIDVDPEHQRKGLGTAMYAEIHRRWPDVPVVHSEHASDDARALNQTLKDGSAPTCITASATRSGTGGSTPPPTGTSTGASRTPSSAATSGPGVGGSQPRTRTGTSAPAR